MKAKLVSLILLSSAPWVYAESTVPKLMSYQGRVTDSAGELIGKNAAVNRAVTFRLYSVSSGGTATYNETQTVTISGGEFSVLIGNGTGLTGLPGPTSPANPIRTLDGVINSATTSALYLGITVDDGNAATVDTEISPRQQLVTGAYSVRSLMAETVASGAITSTMLGNNSVGTNQIAAASITSTKLGSSAVESGNILAGAVTAAKIDTATVGVWTPSGNNIYRNSNVGIGITNPAAVLELGARAGASTPENNGLRVYNPNTSASTNNHAILAAAVNGSTAGSPFLSLDTTVTGWSIGADNTSSGKLVFKNSKDFSKYPRMAIDLSGNVGIGTLSPAAKLHVDGGSAVIQNTSNPSLMVTSGSTNYNELGLAGSAGNFSSSATANDTVLRASGKLHLQSGTAAAALTIDTVNNVGIGTSTPVGRLHISEATGTVQSINGGSLVLDHENNGGVSSIVFRSKTNRTSDYGYMTYQDDYSSTGTGESARLIIGIQNDADDHIILAPSGFVGIGTYTPNVPLTVGSTTNYSINTGSGVTSDGKSYLQEGNPDVYSADGTKGVNTTTAPMSIYSAGGLIAQFVVMRSDERIKDIISQAIPSEELKLVNQLAIQNYKMKDRFSNGETLYKGLIAQQVQEVMPEAVTRSEDYLPDIYSRATGLDFDAAKNQLTVDLDQAHNLVQGEWVRLHTEKGAIEAEIVAAPSSTRFVIATREAATEAFVYGRRVNDLLAVNYDRVFTTGIGAIQELSKKLEEKEATIATLEARLSALEKRMSDSK